MNNRKASFSVIPVKTGIQVFERFWTPASAGVTALRTFHEGMKIQRI